MDQLDTKQIILKTIKYFIFGLSIAISVHLITNEILKSDQLLSIAIAAALIYASMDHFY